MIFHERDLYSALHATLSPGGGGIPASLGGWIDGPASTMRREVRHEVIHAFRLPDTVEGVGAELERWREFPNAAVWIRARIAVLIERLEALERSADGEARADDEPAEPLAHAREDKPAAAVQPAPTVPPGHPSTTQEKARQAVRALLGTGISNREIARRVGVSPSTVAAVQKTAGLPASDLQMQAR